MANRTYSKYTIGEISKLLGLSAQAVRYYEKKEIINPSHSEGSGYRYYTTWDFHMLIRARYYRGLGLSIEETAEILKEEKLINVNKKLKEQEKKIEENIIMNINLLNQIRKSQSFINDYSEQIGKYSIRTRPGIYRINTQKCYTLVASEIEKETIRKWAEKTPFLFSTAVFPKEFVENKNKEFHFGLGVEEKFVEFLKLEKNDFVEYFPPCLCIYTCIPSRSTTILTYESLKGAFEYMKDNGLVISGDIVTQVYSMTKPNDEYFNWHNVWIPIE